MIKCPMWLAATILVGAGLEPKSLLMNYSQSYVILDSIYCPVQKVKCIESWSLEIMKINLK